MNKIYSLKYSHITGGLVAVSELTRKVSVGTSRKKVILGIILSSIYGSYGETAFAAMLDINNIWTRDYLDLAQNRGETGCNKCSINDERWKDISFSRTTCT